MAAAPTLISLVVGVVVVVSLFAASAAFLFLVVGGVVNVFFFFYSPFFLFLYLGLGYRGREVIRSRSNPCPPFFSYPDQRTFKDRGKGILAEVSVRRKNIEKDKKE